MGKRPVQGRVSKNAKHGFVGLYYSAQVFPKEMHNLD